MPWLPELPATVWAGLAAGTLLLLVLRVAASRRRRKRRVLPGIDLHIEVDQLPGDGPPSEGPRLEFFGMPVRLAAVVLAPAGRNSTLPAGDDLLPVLDDLVPGLAAVVAHHRPLLRAWPTQLSTQGFTHAFFNNVQLPGDRGKGTPWCSAAGRFDAGDQQLLAGVLCTADRPNSMSQVAITHVGHWLEVLRVKSD